MHEHQKDSFKSWYILFIPGCRLRWLLWPSPRIILFSSSFVGMQILQLNLNIPSSPTTKSLAWYIPNNSAIRFKLWSSNCFSLIVPRKSLIIVILLQLIWSTWNFYSQIQIFELLNQLFFFNHHGWHLYWFHNQSICNYISLPWMMHQLEIIILQKDHPSSLPHIQLFLIKQVFHTFMATEHLKLSYLQIMFPNFQSKHHNFQL